MAIQIYDNRVSPGGSVGTPQVSNVQQGGIGRSIQQAAGEGERAVAEFARLERETGEAEAMDVNRH